MEKNFKKLVKKMTKDSHVHVRSKYNKYENMYQYDRMYILGQFVFAHVL